MGFDPVRCAWSREHRTESTRGLRELALPDAAGAVTILPNFISNSPPRLSRGTLGMTLLTPVGHSPHASPTGASASPFAVCGKSELTAVASHVGAVSSAYARSRLACPSSGKRRMFEISSTRSAELPIRL